MKSLISSCGVIGNVYSNQELQARITRKRPKSNKKELAKKLGDLLNKRANKTFTLACKGQRKPTPKQAISLIQDIENALVKANGKCTARLISTQDVIVTARKAIKNIRSEVNGGSVSHSYKYPAGSTHAMAVRTTNGQIEVHIGRTYNGGGATTIIAPAKFWQMITVDRHVLQGGGIVGIKKDDNQFDCYNKDGIKVSIAVRIFDEEIIKTLGSKWEHGETLEWANSEIARKKQIIESKKLEEKQNKKLERAAKLFAKIGNNCTVCYNDAKSVGACDLGIRNFADKLNLPIDSKISLSEIYKIEPIWAIRLAKKFLTLRNG